MSTARQYQPPAAAVPGFLTRVWDISSLAYSSSGGRDLRLDLLRGFCVFAMVVDHIGGQSWLATITGDNHFFVSAAEGFVFISGLVLGMVSLKRVRRAGLASAIRAALQRAAKLYVLTIALTLALATYVGALGLPWGWSIHSSDFPGVVLSVLTLHRTFTLTDVLALYTLLMLISPIALLLLASGGTLLLLLGSWGLWAAYQLHPDQVAFPWALEGGTGFPLPAWQLLFATGLVLGYHWQGLTRRLRRLPRIPSMVLLAVLYATLVLLAQSGGEWLAPVPRGNTADFMTRFFDKTTLAPGRLVAFAVVFPLAYLMATTFWRPLRAALGGFLLTLGQNALLSYSLQIGVIGVFLSGRLEEIGLNPNVTSINTLFQAGALALIWLVVRDRQRIATAPRPAVGLLLRATEGLTKIQITFAARRQPLSSSTSDSSRRSGRRS